MINKGLLLPSTLIPYLERDGFQSPPVTDYNVLTAKILRACLTLVCRAGLRIQGGISACSVWKARSTLRTTYGRKPLSVEVHFPINPLIKLITECALEHSVTTCE